MKEFLSALCFGIPGEGDGLSWAVILIIRGIVGGWMFTYAMNGMFDWSPHWAIAAAMGIMWFPIFLVLALLYTILKVLALWDLTVAIIVTVFVLFMVAGVGTIDTAHDFFTKKD